MEPRLWDEKAATFDDEPDHSLLDPGLRRAWANLLLPLMPPVPARILDVGCGTGSLSVLLAQAGYDVVGIDFSERMLQAARGKADAAGITAQFEVGDAAAPPTAAASFEVVLARHVLWAMPDPLVALRAWVSMLKPHGLLVLVEGRWATGAGLAAAECKRLVEQVRRKVMVEHLDDPALWGHPITDERFLLTGRS